MTKFAPQEELTGWGAAVDGLAKAPRPLPRRQRFQDNAARNYSGPIPGQMVMGVHNLGGDEVGHVSRGAHTEPFYAVDHTGFVQELGDSGRHGPRKWVSPVDISARHNVQQTVHLYRKYGGSFADNPRVQAHWDSQPLHQIPSDAPVHTGQDPRETLWGDDALDVHSGALAAEHAEGRQRVNAIRASLQAGEPLRNPAWLVKRAGRLYSLDGHHRVLAAREEGLSHYPARVWDMDAEQAAKAAPTPANVPAKKAVAAPPSAPQQHSPAQIQALLAEARARRAQRDGRS